MVLHAREVTLLELAEFAGRLVPAFAGRTTGIFGFSIVYSRERNENNNSLDRDTDGNGSSALLSTIATTSGTWSIGVKIKSGAVSYDVLVDTTAE